MKPNRPIVIFSPDPPPDLNRPRLAVQFAAGATVGLLAAALLMPVMLPAQPLCQRIEARR
jgi:hypothetical protein